jgi:hypothetical protein
MLKLKTKTKKLSVEFYLVDAFEIFHFEPIYHKLKEKGHKAIFVAEPCDINTAKNWFDYDEAIKILNDKGLDYKKKCDPNCDIALTTQYADSVSKYKNKKVALHYGTALNKDIFYHNKKSTLGFDAKLVHGEFSKRLLSKYINKNKIFCIGYPKHDLFWKYPINRNSVLNKFPIQTKKNILLYFPTWDSDCSIQKFGDKIKELKSDFFIVSKPHHCTYRLTACRQDMDTLYDISDLVLTGNSSFEEAIVASDVILADAKSGASTESVYLKEKPAVFFSMRENWKKDFYPEINELGILINDPNDLKPTLLSELYIKSYSDKTSELLYGKKDGESSEHAVSALINIFTQKF